MCELETWQVFLIAVVVGFVLMQLATGRRR